MTDPLFVLLLIAFVAATGAIIGLVWARRDTRRMDRLRVDPKLDR